MKEFVTPKQIARAIGVSESSLKRWCDKGMLPTVRTAGGHRRIRMSSVLEFLRQTQQSLVHPELLGLPPFLCQAPTQLDRARADLRAALEAGDEFQCRLLLQLYLSQHSVCEICDKVIAGAFRDIGDAWTRGAVEVYQERRACEICLRILHELRAALPPASAAAPLAIGGTLGRDPYQIATKSVELTLREAGWRAESYGSALPAATWCAALRDTRPRVFWLSVSWIESPEEFLADYCSLFAAANGLGTAVLVGGQALTPELRHQMPYSAYCDTFRHVANFAATLYRPPADPAVEPAVEPVDDADIGPAGEPPA
jgi:excisionase family DNA binding protein